MANTWNYRNDTYRSDTSLAGFSVEAIDGGIGNIAEHSSDPGAGYIVVDTGFWIFGKKRLLPAGVIERVDYDDETVHVAMTKDQIKDAPDLDDADERSDPEWYRRGTDDYYDPYSWR